jgi:integrase
MPKTAKKPTALARPPKPRAPRTQLATDPRKLDDAAAAYAGASRAENTKRAYTNDFVMFSAWCREQGLAPMPALPRTVALYLTSLAVGEKKVATIERALVAISQAHKLHGLPSPREAAEVTEVLQGIRRTLGVAPNQKDPLLVNTLRALVEPMRRDDPGDTRDRALLCLGFASGCRRSERVALDVADLSFGDDGLEITIRRSKTDQEGLGRKVGIPYGGRPRTCPVRAVRDWLDLSLLAEGPLFRPVNRFGKILPTAHGSERGTDRQALGSGGGPRPCALCRALAPLWARHCRRQGRQERAVNHEADRPPLSQRRSAVHPRCRALR